ncbi:MAG: hypothetical protein H7Y13_01610 [Sphingobacteriaceae bacterium]|nr:hypothetical protein [Sphingobacteriaceae bacterium]
MDVFDEELLKFWKALNSNAVEYLMVGGVAVNLHGFQRTTADIDVWINDTIENRRSLRIAFFDYGLGDFETLERMQFIPGWTYFHLNNGIRVDIMTSIKGLEDYSFLECLEFASIATIYETEIAFLHVSHLLQSKKASNRPKDQIDIIALEKIKKLSDRNQ